MLLRSIALYTSLLVAANALAAVPAAAGPVDWQAAREAGLAKLTDGVQAVPDVPFTDAGGKQVSLADWKGKALLVNFWATWCAPCREEMPSLDRLQAEAGGEDLAVLTVATGRNSPQGISRFFEDEGITALPRYTDADMSLARSMAVFGLPVTVILDRDGQEVARLTGGADWNSDSARAILDAIAAPGG